MHLAPDFWTAKTTWTSLAAILAAVGGAVTHQIGWPEAVFAIFAALQVAFHRDAVVKSLDRQTVAAVGLARLAAGKSGR
jgi:hypothetical protein